MVWGDSCFRRNGMGGFLLSQEWYGGIPAFAGMVWGDSGRNGAGHHIPAFAGMVWEDSGFRMHGIEYYRFPVFAGMVVVIRRCTRHHAGLDPASIGFLLSQEWYRRISAFAGMAWEDSGFRMHGIGYYRIPVFAGMV